MSNAELELSLNGQVNKMAKRKTNKTSKSNKNGLTAAEIQKFRELLLAKRAELLGNVSTMEDETFKKERSELSSMPFHMADAGSDNFEQEFTLDLMDSEKKMLKEITDALNRIGEGTFGVFSGSFGSGGETHSISPIWCCGMACVCCFSSAPHQLRVCFFWIVVQAVCFEVARHQLLVGAVSGFGGRRLSVLGVGTRVRRLG